MTTAPGAPIVAPSMMSKVVDRLKEQVSRKRDHMQRALLLAVKWNQPGFARRILLDLNPMRAPSGSNP